MLDRLRREIRAFAGGLPGPAYWLLGGMLVNRIGTFVVPYLALYLTDRRGASAAEAGAIASLWGVGTIASGPVGGVLADRAGRRRTLVAALAVSGAGMVALGFAERLDVIAPAVLVLGFTTECFRPAMQAAIADLVPDPAARVRAYGLVYWTVNLGLAVSLAAAGLLVALSYTLLFVLDGATTLAFAALVLARVPETRPAPAASGAVPAWRGLARALSDGTLVALVGLNFLFCLMLWQVHAALPIDMRTKGVTATAYGLLMSLSCVAVIVLQPLASRIAAGRDGGRVLAAAALAHAVGWGLNAVAGDTAAYAAAILVWTVGEVFTAPTSNALVAEIAPEDLRGRYQGAYALSWAVAAAVGPGLGALVLGRHGGKVLWGGCFALGLLLAAGHLAAAGPRRRRLAALRAVATG